jgi:hypothetical protein
MWTWSLHPQGAARLHGPCSGSLSQTQLRLAVWFRIVPLLCRQRDPRVLHDQEEGPTESATHFINLLQPSETAQLPEEEHVA